jgi:Tol biopolymer transport system component
LYNIFSMFTNIYNIQKKLLFLSLTLLILSGCLKRPQPQAGDFSGKVVDAYTQEAVPGVTLDIGGQNTTTDLDGKFSIAVLPPGDYQLILAREWYNSRTFDVHHIGKQKSLEFPLIPLPLEGKILYSGNRTKNWEIYELDLSNNRSVTQRSNTTYAEINPIKIANNQIIFQSDRSGNGDLFLCDIDAINIIDKAIPCCSPVYKDEYPSVDQTGTKLVFKSGESDKNGKEEKVICLYNLQSKELVVIKDGAQNITGYNPAINQAGTKIALVSGNYEKLLLFDVNGMMVTKSKEFDFYASNKLKINNPCWCPTEDDIAFEAYQDSDGPRAIYRISIGSPTASSLKQVSFNQGSGSEQHKNPCWSKKGMIFFSLRSDIYGVKVIDGSVNNKPLIMVSPGSGDKEYISWSE